MCTPSNNGLLGPQKCAAQTVSGSVPLLLDSRPLAAMHGRFSRICHEVQCSGSGSLHTVQMNNIV